MSNRGVKIKGVLVQQKLLETTLNMGLFGLNLACLS